MAGGYVHCLVAMEALKNLYTDSTLTQYRTITESSKTAPYPPYFPYVCLGSVSPDYPYAAMKMDGVNDVRDANHRTWGDKFHKEKTGDFVTTGLQKLRSITNKNDDSFFKQTAWVMGYYSHVITDLVVHAVVYKLVGGCYEEHISAHIHCEVVQDSMLFHDVYNPQELVDAKFLQILEKCHYKKLGPAEQMGLPTVPESMLDDDIRGFWDSILQSNYGDFYAVSKPQINEWNKYYSSLMGLATTALARVAGPKEAYHRTTDIDNGDKDKYYRAMNLPDGSTNKKYKEDVFDKAIGEVTNRLKDFLIALDSGASLKVRNWNLDKGTYGGGDLRFTLWGNAPANPTACPGDPT